MGVGEAGRPGVDVRQEAAPGDGADENLVREGALSRGPGTPSRSQAREGGQVLRIDRLAWDRKGCR